ncbi:hypothetical protein NDU88_005646 [Pleurodeles waltl]|uniref:Reverse transcriptase domain-containing protein n=1 Tax=Pleurodeles waltl TaxID=8319 RepID=A0AAV7MDG8_PLEWA|nr:hypothetical protein NDU88_005646 [Pleurodeles waltl]
MRPIVSTIGSAIEPLSKYVDTFLKPMVALLPSYIRDTGHFISKIEGLQYRPDGEYLVTMDLESLYTNIPQQEAIDVVALYLNRRGDDPALSFILKCLETVLFNNYFDFNGKMYHQIKGVSMGAACAPSVANLYVGAFEDKIIYNEMAPFYENVRAWSRFIDDVFFIWKGSEDQLLEFYSWLNLCDSNLRFTIKYDHHLSGDVLAEAAFDLEKLESYKVAQLKQFCSNVGCPIKSSSKKDELQKALRAWVTAKAAEGHTDEEPEGEEELQVTHTDVVGGPAMSQGRISRAGSSVSSKSLTPGELQDRQAEREYQLELKKLSLEVEQRKLALEERKINMAHELSLKEIDQRSQSSRDGGSNSTVQPERRVHIPKDLVRDYKREDDIYLWFKGYESALHMNLVPEAQWGAALWKHFEAEGRDTLTALGDAQSLTYPAMKEALLTRAAPAPH